ncbi:hypothetical protein PG989_006827 [Apiospora arundinis]
MSKKPTEERHKVSTQERPKPATAKPQKGTDWWEKETAESKEMVLQKPSEKEHNKEPRNDGNGLIKSFFMRFVQFDAIRKRKGTDDKKDWVGEGVSSTIFLPMHLPRQARETKTWQAKGVRGAHSVAKNTGSIWVGGNATDTNTGAQTDGKSPSHAQAYDTGLVFAGNNADMINTGAQASNGASAHAENTGRIGVQGSAKNLNAGATSRLDDKHHRKAT